MRTGRKRQLGRLNRMARDPDAPHLVSATRASGSGFVRIGAERANRALRAGRFFGNADAAAMVLQQVTEAHALFRWYERIKIKLNLVRIGVRREPQSLRKPHNMGIDDDRWLAEDIAEDDVRCFSTYAGERKESR